MPPMATSTATACARSNTSLTQDSSFKTLAEVIAGGGKVGYERGVWVVGQLLKQQVPPAQLVETANMQSGLAMLAAGRIHAYVHTDTKVADAITALEHRKQIKLRSAGTLIQVVLHPVLNERHRDLAPAFAREVESVLHTFCEVNHGLAAANLPLLCAGRKQLHALELR